MPAPNASIGGALARDVLPMALVRVLGGVVNFVVLLLLVRRTPPATVGLYYFLVTLWNVLHVVVDFGGEPIATREIARREVPEGGVIRDYLAAKLSLSLLGLGLFLGTVFLWVQPEARAAFLFSLVTLPGYYLASLTVLFRVRHRLVRAAVAWAVGELVFLGLGAGALLLLAEPALRFRVLAVAVAARFLVTGLLILCLARPFLPPLRGGRGPRWFLRECWPQGVATVATTLYFYVDTLMLKALRGDAEAGYYNVAFRLLNFFVLAAGITAVVALPMLTRADRGGRGRLRELYQGIFAALLLVALPVAALGGALAEDVFRVLYGEALGAYAQSVPTLRVLLLAGLGTYGSALASYALVAFGRQGLFAAVAGAALLFKVVVNLLVIPPYGHYGAAWATLATELLVLGLSVGLVWRLRGLLPAGGHSARALALAAAAAVLALALRPLAPALAFTAGLLLYVGGVWALRLFPAGLFRMDLFVRGEEP